MLPKRSLLILLFLPAFFLNTHGFSYNLHPLTSHILEIGDRVQKGVLKFLDGFHGKKQNSTTLVLATERTRRKDPTNDFKYYTSGWNISNNHYYYSTAFTAIPLLIIATIWFTGCGLSLLFLSLRHCCCRKKPYGFLRTTYAFSLILLSLFTVTTIVGCIVLYIGQGKFSNTTSQTLQYVMHQANTTTQNLKVVSKYLAAAKSIRVGPLSLPSTVRKSIDKVESRIDFASHTIESKAYTTKNKIVKDLDKVSLALIIVAAVMLLLALLGFMFSILGLQSAIYILVTIGWVLAAGTFILCGVFLVLHNVVGDTCVAMDEWVQNPTAHTSLDDILTCVDNSTAQDILTQSKNVTYLLVGLANKILANVSNIVDHNQSRQLVPLLCNPFNRDLSDRICAPGELNFTQAVQISKDYACQVVSSVCTKVGRLTPGMYEQINNVVDLSLGIYYYGPILISLLDCSIVRETFKKIHRDYCPGLKQYSKRIYIGLVMASVAVTLSLVFWMLYARKRRQMRCSEIEKTARVGDSKSKRIVPE